MAAQPVARCQMRVVKIIGDIALHTDFFHHPNGPLILCRRKRHDFIKRPCFKPIFQTGPRRFRRQALPPSKFLRIRQPISTAGGKMRAKFSEQQAGKADKYIVWLQNEGQTANSRSVRDGPLCAPIVPQFHRGFAWREKFHHLGIAIHRGKIVNMRFGEMHQMRVCRFAKLVQICPLL